MKRRGGGGEGSRGRGKGPPRPLPQSTLRSLIYFRAFPHCGASSQATIFMRFNDRFHARLKCNSDVLSPPNSQTHAKSFYLLVPLVWPETLLCSRHAFALLKSSNLFEFLAIDSTKQKSPYFEASTSTKVNILKLGIQCRWRSSSW